MSLIKFRAKVNLMSEDDMEIEDIVSTPKSKVWVWKNIAFDAMSIYRIISYDSNKCIVILEDNEKILVKGTFDDVFSNWKNSLEYEDDLILGEEDEVEGEEDNQITGS